MGKVVSFKWVDCDRYTVWCVQALSRADWDIELHVDWLVRQIG